MHIRLAVTIRPRPPPWWVLQQKNHGSPVRTVSETLDLSSSISYNEQRDDKSIRQAKGGSRPPRPYAGGRPSHTADLSAPSVIIPFFSVRFQEGNSVCVLLCGVGIVMPCAAFVVSAVQEALGGRGGPTPKGGTSRTAAGNGDVAAFCPNCGNKIADNTPHQAAPALAAYDVPYQSAPPKAAKKPSVAKTILIAIVVIIAILVYIYKKVQFY